MKLLLYIEVDIWVPLIQALSLEDLASWLYIEDDMRAPCVSSLLNVSKAAVDQKKKEIAKIRGWKINPTKERFIVHGGWHLGPTSQQRPLRLEGDWGSKEKKANSQKLGVQNNSKKGNVYCS
jgi:hypothetical protein